mmetsp:Transcript_68196/g.175809  ORF Transcript_68196/g.175809 Transcript_68196/m.175809 type:complete len:250 (+) Transcript_68196:163-912(+)
METRILAVCDLHVSELLHVRLQSLDSGLQHAKRLLAAASTEQLLVRPVLCECRRMCRIREVDQRVAKVVPPLLIPRAVEEVEVPTHGIRQVLEHGEEGPLGEVRRHVGDEQRGRLGTTSNRGLVPMNSCVAAHRPPMHSVVLHAHPRLRVTAARASTSTGGSATSGIVYADCGVAAVAVRGRMDSAALVAAAAVASSGRRPCAGVIAPGHLRHAGAVARGPGGPICVLAVVTVVHSTTSTRLARSPCPR